MERAMKPCKFTFDGTPEFDGFALGSTWNGFDNVSVTPAVREQIAAYFRQDAAQNGFDYDEAYGGIDEIPVGADGLVCLGWGYATQIVEGSAK
jgi:hypothetical protein